MSKVYESLLRAELERLAGEAPAEVSPANKGKDSEGQPAKDLARLKAAAEATAATGVEDPLQHGSPAAAAFPWHRIAVRPWRPSVAKLPSLQRTAPAAEQFRSLRARLYEYRDFNKLKTVLVSSGMPQEGKSFVAVNLAVVLAHRRGSRVLLIDADLRRYSLNKILGCEPTPGLADYLSGKAEAIDVMQRADMPEAAGGQPISPLANLTFIPAGSGGDSVADLGTSERFRQLIDGLESVFDWIIVDSSPVNLVSDAVHYARDCDGVLLVVRSGFTKYEVAQRAQAEFKSGNLLGVVLNGSTDAPASYYGYGTDGTER